MDTEVTVKLTKKEILALRPAVSSEKLKFFDLSQDSSYTEVMREHFERESYMYWEIGNKLEEALEESS